MFLGSLAGLSDGRVRGRLPNEFVRAPNLGPANYLSADATNQLALGSDARLALPVALANTFQAVDTSIFGPVDPGPPRTFTFRPIPGGFTVLQQEAISFVPQEGSADIMYVLPRPSSVDNQTISYNVNLNGGGATLALPVIITVGTNIVTVEILRPVGGWNTATQANLLATTYLLTNKSAVQ